MIEFAVEAVGQVDDVGRAAGVVAVGPVTMGQWRIDVDLEGGGDRRQPGLRISALHEEIANAQSL